MSARDRIIANVTASYPAQCVCGHCRRAHDHGIGYCRAHPSRREPCGCRVFAFPPSTDRRYGARCVHCDRTISHHHRAYAACHTARELRQGAALTYFKAQS